MDKILSQGAEAIIFKQKNYIIKKRIKKSYRISEIDEKIRRLRTRSETKLLDRASKIIPVPKIIKSDEKTKEIKIQFVEGKKLSEFLDKVPLKKQKQICRKIGESVSKIHDRNIIHGDLTTSNMILNKDLSEDLIINKNLCRRGRRENSKNNFKIFFIDFGLGYFNGKYEDKAVDIHLLKQALEAKHFENWKILYEEFLKGYKSFNQNQAEKVLNQLQKVEKRGRYRN